MKKSSLHTAVTTFLVIGLPSIVFAQTLTNTKLLVGSARSLINTGIGVLSALALLVFIWGIVKYILSAGDEDKAKEGKSIMIYGVIALFVLFTVFGIVTFIRQEFNLGTGSTFTPPQVTVPLQ